MRHLPTFAALIFSSSLAAAQSLPLKIDLSAPIPAATHTLKMGGADPSGLGITADSSHLWRGNVPLFPVMGEMHYSRYPHEEWEREIMKMKAGGITVVSAYIFWIHHEEIENQWDWTGNNDLRTFVQLCAKHGLNVWLRLGPWDHGEVRNGGFPDWLIAKFPNQRQLRSTDPAFLAETRKLYEQIFAQVKGLLYKDGGPVIGIQVENEMRNNAPYMLALKNLAKEIGFDVPLYSMTGWGPAQVPQDELLPMFGGYGDGFWITGPVTGQSRVQYFFTHNPNDERIALTSAPSNLAYLVRYPYLTCEIGGGMAIAYARRPLMDWKDVAAVALNKLGNGSMLMGYYMYQGGANPLGKLTTLQEQESTPITNDNDLPNIHYDFQAPLGEFGQVRPVYHALRMLHMFIADFGPELCMMPSTLPEVLPKNLEDTDTLRWEARSDGHSGFLFIDNHERGVALPPKAAQFALHTADGDMTVPLDPVIIPTDAFVIWPFNLDLNGVKLKYATSQLLCKLNGDVPTYVFFAPNGLDPQFAFDSQTLASIDGATGARTDQKGISVFHSVQTGIDNLFTVHSPDGKSANILLLPQDLALRSYKINIWGADRLVLSKQSVSWDDQTLFVESSDPTAAIGVYPRPNIALSVPAEVPPLGSNYAILTVRSPAKNINLQIIETREYGPARKVPMSSKRKPLPLPPTDKDFDAAAVFHIAIPPDALDGVADVLLKVDYIGDVARAYVGDRLIDDDFYFGQPWEIGLRRFGPDVFSKGITLKILPLAADNPALLDPNVHQKPGPDGMEWKSVRFTPEVVYESNISVK
jgi:hypothetical protein